MTSFRRQRESSVPRAAQSISIRAMAPFAAPRPHVLIVDDVTETRRLLADFVHRRGYHTLEAAEGAEAMALLRAYHPRVCAIILDLQMQGMDGFAFRHAQLEEPALAAVPVIVVTASGRREILQYTLKVDDVIFKPTITGELDEALVRHCNAAGRAVPQPQL